MHLLLHQRAGNGFGEEGALAQEVAVAFFAKVHLEVFERDGVAVGDVGDVGMADVVAVEDHHEARADGFHLIAFGDEHARVFAEADADAAGVAGHSLRQAPKAAALFEVRVDNDGVDKPQARGHFHFALEVGLRGIAFVDHGAAHGHGARRGAGDDEILGPVAIEQDVEKLRAAEGGAEAQLVAAAEEDGRAVEEAVHIFLLRGVGAVADAHHAHVGAADLTEGVEVVGAHFVGDHRGGGHHLDAGGGAAGLGHNAAQDAELKEVEVVAFDLALFQVGALVFGAAYGDELSFGIWLRHWRES